jgi:hypothetical protein
VGPNASDKEVAAAVKRIIRENHCDAAGVSHSATDDEISAGFKRQRQQREAEAAAKAAAKAAAARSGAETAEERETREILEAAQVVGRFLGKVIGPPGRIDFNK